MPSRRTPKTPGSRHAEDAAGFRGLYPRVRNLSRAIRTAIPAAAGRRRRAALRGATVTERTRRLAENEALFREVNESIEVAALSLTITETDGFLYEFLCECSDTSCGGKVRMTCGEYEHVRGNGTWFAVVPHHNLPEIEDVVEEHEGYWVVQKRGETGEHVAVLDPRRANQGRAAR